MAISFIRSSMFRLSVNTRCSRQVDSLPIDEVTTGFSRGTNSSPTGLGARGETTSRGERDNFLGAGRCAQRLIATHSLRARESATACTMCM